MANHESTWNLVEDKGTWVVRVRIWNPNTGKYTQKSKTTGLKVKDKTKNRAKKLAPEIASEVVKAFRREVGCDSARHMETFKDYVEEWVSFRKRSTWANTAMSYRGYAEKHIIPKLGGYKVQEIDWRILQRFCDNLLKTHKCASVRKYMIVVSGALKDAMKDGVIDPIGETAPDLYNVKAFVEKPDVDKAPSDLAIIGRYLLTPEIFDMLDKQKAGAGGEIQLTDAIDALNKTQRVFAHEFKGQRFDVGNKEGYMETSIQYGLRHPETKDALRKYIIDLGKKLESEGKKKPAGK